MKHCQRLLCVPGICEVRSAGTNSYVEVEVGSPNSVARRASRQSYVDNANNVVNFLERPQ